MHAWESIQKTIDYIEANLPQEHSPEQLAVVANLSPFYFQRLFTRLVKRPVCEYIKMRRLAKACGLLEDKNKRILDIALACGFGSHASFTKIFKLAFGITPAQYRHRPVHLNQVMKPNLLLNYTAIEENIPLITDGIVVEITRRTLTAPEHYIGLATQVPFAQQTPVGNVTGIDVPGMLWEQFHRKKGALQSCSPNSIEIGVSTMEQNAEGSFPYFVGTSVLDNVIPAADLTSYKLPAAEYIVCCVEAESFKELTTSALGKSMNYLFGTWLPKQNLSARPFCVEKYNKTDPAVYKMELWIIPVPLTSMKG